MLLPGAKNTLALQSWIVFSKQLTDSPFAFGGGHNWRPFDPMTQFRAHTGTEQAAEALIKP
jgi:hypothetical protein